MHEKPESVPFLPVDQRGPSSLNFSKCSKTTWLVLSSGTLLNVVLFLSTVLMHVQWNAESDPGPLQSDIKDAWKAVQYETRTFTGSLKWDRDTGNLFREKDYSTEYFGPPGEKLDTAWEGLFYGAVFLS